MKKNKKINYGVYLVKRIIRIYLPYLIAILFTLLLMKIFYSGPQENIRWIHKFWNDDVSLQSLVNHLLLIGDYNTDAINPVIWSLVHEMRISIIFPFLVIIIIKLKWTQSLLLALFLSAAGTLISYLGLDVSQGYLTSYAHTIHYTSIFIIGSLMAINKDVIISEFKKATAKIQLVFFVTGVCIYTLQMGLSYFVGIDTGLFFREWFIALGASMLMIVSFSSERASVFLLKKPVEFLGNISYSLYLYHLPILIAGYYALHNMFPKPIICLILLPIILIVSTLSWKLVENKSVLLGRLVSNRWDKEQKKIIQIREFRKQ